jgi:hypothetical protein
VSSKPERSERLTGDASDNKAEDSSGCGLIAATNEIDMIFCVGRMARAGFQASLPFVAVVGMYFQPFFK